jgi:hypothetical protein
MKTLTKQVDFLELAKDKSRILNDDFLGEVAISVWRLEKTLESGSDFESRPELVRSLKILQRLSARLQEKGVRISEQTGQPYDEGMALRVISSEKRSDLSRNLIVETITPSVFLRENLIHAGEVIVGLPTLEKNSK